MKRRARKRHGLRPWVELEAVLKEAGLTLTDVSSSSTLPDRRTTISIQYLSNLRSGYYLAGPNERVINELTAALGCPAEELTPAEDDEPEALAS